MKLSLCSFLHPPVTPSLFGTNILLNILVSNTLSLCSPLTVREELLYMHFKLNIYFQIRQESNSEFKICSPLALHFYLIMSEIFYGLDGG
jgi:hypothetical protein